MAKTDFSSSRRTGKYVLIILGLMLLVHLVLFLVYAQANKRAERKVNHDIVVQQVLNIIEKIYTTPPDLQQKIASSVDISNVYVSIDERPKSSMRFGQDASLWDINQKLLKQHAKIRLSLALGNNEWLNVAASIVPTSWWLQVFLLVLELVAITALLFSLVSIHRFSGPLKQFQKAANRLGIDVDPPPLLEYGPALVRETAHAMNKMQERIRNLIQERTQMLAALSHDLRTPITRMKLRAQFISDQELHQKTMNDLDEMEQMISETLAFAKHDADLENKIRFDLDSLLASITDDFQDMGYPVQYAEMGARLLLKGRPVALKRAFNNLVQNAVKYAGNADISVAVTDKKITVKIDDNGPGIPDDQLDKVFTPFYRGEASRSRNTGGTGLGLAVVRDIIRAHQGTVKLIRREEGGLRAEVSLVRES